MEMVEPFGFETVFERSVAGHSAAVNHLVDEFRVSCIQLFSPLPAIFPSSTSSEIDFALNAASEPVTLLPSRDWTGTNGVVFIPPARISMEYGEGSFRRHLSKVSAAGLRSDVMDLPGYRF